MNNKLIFSLKLSKIKLYYQSKYIYLFNIFYIYFVSKYSFQNDFFPIISYKIKKSVIIFKFYKKSEQ
jgi:hypothetical protein